MKNIHVAIVSVIEAIGKLIRKILFSEIFKFGLAGGTGYLLNIIILYEFTDIVGLHYLMSAGIALLVNSVWNYVVNCRLTFKRKENISGYIKYFGMTMLTRIAYFGLLFWLTSLMGLYYIYSSVFAVFACFILNYILSKKYVWNKKTNGMEERE